MLLSLVMIIITMFNFIYSANLNNQIFEIEKKNNNEDIFDPYEYPLQYAIYNNNIKLLNSILEDPYKKNLFINKVNHEGISPLSLALILANQYIKNYNKAILKNQDSFINENYDNKKYTTKNYLDCLKFYDYIITTLINGGAILTPVNHLSRSKFEKEFNIAKKYFAQNSNL